MVTTFLPTDDMRMEIFCLIWLDGGMNDKDIRDTEQKLRSISNRLKTFQDVKQCQKYIEQRSQQDRLIMIVSGRLGREIVPSIHQLQQVISIYVYCMDKIGNKQWADKYAKVKAVVVELDELISRIKADHKIHKTVQEPLSINVFSTSGDAGKSTGGVNGQFVFSQVLIDCLLRLKATNTDKNEFIKLCKDAYADNRFELGNLCEFEQNYTSDNVLMWYTRDSFFYKTLNAALRSENIHMIFLLRGFISDIQHQLKYYQVKDPLRVYRGQMISSDELKQLKQCRGEFISVNSFFSTSTDDQQARVFLDIPDSAANLEPVLFEIDADPKMATTKPFADISAHSEFPDESEILFMLGSIFRLNSVNRSSDGQVWIIRMTLSSENEHDLKEVLMYMKQQTGSGYTNLRTLGKVLWKMGKLHLAEQYLSRFLKELPSNDFLRGNLYEDLGELASLAGDYDKSVKLHQEALEFKSSNQSVSTPVKEVPNYSMVIPKIAVDARWAQNGVTVAGGLESGSTNKHLKQPCGLFVDDDQTIVIAEFWNHRIVQWTVDDKNGQVVAGGNGAGSRLSQLSCPTDVLIDKGTDSLIICDWFNRRVVRWPRCSDNKQQEILIDNIKCYGLAMDDQSCLYVSDTEKHEVRRYQIGDKHGTVLAGGHGCGTGLHQLNKPTFIFVDQQKAVYVSDYNNHRVMKWDKGAAEGIVVAGGQGQGNARTQLNRPEGLFVDLLGTVYVTDSYNYRVMRWPKEAKEGTVIVGGNGEGSDANQFFWPIGLSFDRHGNLYVTDGGHILFGGNNRVQRFSIE